MDTKNLADLKLITPVVVEEAAPAPQQKAEPQKQTVVKTDQQVSTVREIMHANRPEVVQKGTSVTREGQSPPIPGAQKGQGRFSGTAQRQPVRHGDRHRANATSSAPSPPLRG